MAYSDINGFVPLRAGEVHKLARGWLKARQEHIDAERGYLIKELMERTFKRWSWRKLRYETFKYDTIEKAIARLKESDIGLYSPWDLPTLEGSWYASRMEELALATAPLSDDARIYVNTKVMRALFNVHDVEG